MLSVIHQCDNGSVYAGNKVYWPSVVPENTYHLKFPVAAAAIPLSVTTHFAINSNTLCTCTVIRNTFVPIPYMFWIVTDESQHFRVRIDYK